MINEVCALLGFSKIFCDGSLLFCGFPEQIGSVTNIFQSDILFMAAFS